MYGLINTRAFTVVSIILDFPNFKQLNHAFKGPIWQKIGQGSNLLSQKLQIIHLIAMSL
jgi:hypothetical protein